MDDDQQSAQDEEQDEPVQKRSMRDRLRKAVPPEPSTDDGADDALGADADADRRAMEDEFWNKK
jgi:hypothetical protein